MLAYFISTAADDFNLDISPSDYNHSLLTNEIPTLTNSEHLTNDDILLSADNNDNNNDNKNNNIDFNNVDNIISNNVIDTNTIDRAQQSKKTTTPSFYNEPQALRSYDSKRSERASVMNDRSKSNSIEDRPIVMMLTNRRRPLAYNGIDIGNVPRIRCCKLAYFLHFTRIFLHAVLIE